MVNMAKTRLAFPFFRFVFPLFSHCLSHSFFICIVQYILLFLIHIAVLHCDRCPRCSLQRNEEIILLVIFQAPWLLYVSSFFLCLLCDLSPATLCSLWSLFGKEKRSVQSRKTFKQPDLQGNENRNFQGTRAGFAELATTLKVFLLLLLFRCCLFVCFLIFWISLGNSLWGKYLDRSISNL